MKYGKLGCRKNIDGIVINEDGVTRYRKTRKENSKWIQDVACADLLYNDILG